MKLRLIAAGTRMPAWVDAGVAQYSGRLPRDWRFDVREIALGRRGKSIPADRARDDEGKRMLAALSDSERVVCLDVGGRSLDTAGVAAMLERFSASGVDTALLIGGPDGLSDACLARAELRWSLSPLTLPHGLARIVTVEALYRGASVNANHPYHRE